MIRWMFEFYINVKGNEEEIGVVHFSENGQIVCSYFSNSSVKVLLREKICEKDFCDYSTNDIKDFRENITELKNLYEDKVNFCNGCIIAFFG